ncbi:MAG: chromosome segregation ATPase, partial [Aureispira sp.]
KLDEAQKEQQLLNLQLETLEQEERLIKGEYADAMETLSEIDQTLGEMAQRNQEMDKLIQQKELAKGTTKEQAIMVRLQSLKNANIEADKKARRLRTKVRAFKVENLQLKKMIAQLETRFVEVELEVNKVQTTVGNMQISLNRLEAEVSVTATELSSTYADLKVKTSKLERTNTKLETTLSDLQSKNAFIEEDANAYIVCGDKQILRKNKILRLLSAQTLTTEYQSQVKLSGTKFDYFNNLQIDCTDGEIQYLLPARDPNSYKIENEVVTILDKKTFWSTSKTVVLVKK